jgi:hypothetical protein
MHCFSRRGHWGRSGPSTRIVFLLAGTLGLSSACSSEKERRGENVGGSGGGTAFDPTVPNPLPGDGLEPTPEIDVSDREVINLPSDEFIDSISDVRDEIDGTDSSSAPDASAGDAGGADAAADAADAAP